jgi:hypothetical protein
MASKVVKEKKDKNLLLSRLSDFDIEETFLPMSNEKHFEMVTHTFSTIFPFEIIKSYLGLFVNNFALDVSRFQHHQAWSPKMAQGHKVTYSFR